MEEPLEIKIYHINDLHSRYENLAKIASILKSLRKEGDILCDIGDNADFMRLEVECTQGEISSALLNEMKCDLRVFGNNEGFAGDINCEIMSTTFTGSTITANLYNLSTENKLSNLEDAKIIEIQGIKILFIGLTAPYNQFYHLYNIHSKDPIEEFQRVVLNYSADEYDLLILLSHLGLEQDKKIAEEFPIINIIVGSHSHTDLIEPLKIKNTTIVQAGSYGKYLGVLQLIIDKGSKKIIHSRDTLINSDCYEMDAGIRNLLQFYEKYSQKIMSEELYYIDINLPHSFYQENILSNFLADALQKEFPCDFAIINSGILNNSINAGAITKAIVQLTSPSPLNPTYMEIQGMYIWNALEKSLLEEYQNIELHGDGFRGKQMGNLAVSSNVQVYFTPTSYEGKKISHIQIDSQPLEKEKWYEVVTSDHLQRGNGYNDLGYNRNIKFDGKFMRHVLENNLKNLSSFKFITQKRFIPIEGNAK